MHPVRAALVFALVLVVLLAGNARAAIPAATARMRLADVGVAREVVVAVVLGFLQEEIVANRTTPWLSLLTTAPPAHQSLEIQAILMTHFQKHATRNMQRPPCAAYGEALVETLQAMRANEMGETPAEYRGNLGRAGIVARAIARCVDAVTEAGTGNVLSPLQHEALRKARAHSVLVTSAQAAANLPPDTVPV